MRQQEDIRKTLAFQIFQSQLAPSGLTYVCSKGMKAVRMSNYFFLRKLEFTQTFAFSYDNYDANYFYHASEPFESSLVLV